ncbi:MAG: tetraacyldisaccharide 4'-kinase [Bacteroidales bacterium]|nr:tetraacyldisaccharide 4'-kinase [Bacteroidales bacterium]
MLYRLVLALRHLFYDKGWKKRFKAPVPTVCIGNITVGGTGKTPFTEWVLRCLLQSDDWAYSNIAVLSRGYKRKKKGFQIVSREGSAADYGDEPLQLARKFPSVTVAVDKDRVEGCRKLAEGDSGAEIIVLDDAYQYRKLAADVNIVLVDYHRPVFKDKLMPWGRLRDLPSRLLKADFVVVTKCPAFLGDWDRQEWRRLLRLKDSQQLFFTTISYGTPEAVFEEADARYTYAQRLVLVTGIANDAPLRSYLSDTYKISKRLSFPDHHKYTRADIRSVSAAVKEQPTACVMTTEKDAQRLRDVPKVPDTLRQRLFYIPIRAEFLTPEDAAAFTAALLARVRR